MRSLLVTEFDFDSFVFKVKRKSLWSIFLLKHVIGEWNFTPPRELDLCIVVYNNMQNISPFLPKLLVLWSTAKNLGLVCSSSPLELSCCACAGESNLGGWDTRITNHFFGMIAFAISMLCFNLTFFYFQTFIFLWLDKEKACWSSYKYYLWWEGYALLFWPIVIRLWSFSFNTL